MPAEKRNEDSDDQFPVGMRVLAVDDDPICLKVLETLLRRCQYQVTTTSQAVMALKLLRENKDKFDLVISDVQMPDMDGFKLLELVGLDMDLPVIMLSAYGDTKLVMNGITHGACDYLLKPVRVEELKNIWQHVVRRRKTNSEEISSGKDNKSCGFGEKNKSTGMNNNDQNAKMVRKRKDQNEEEEEELYDENGSDNEDSTNQKKPRVVWSGALHCKFAAAVHALGLDKAVPKKILELMNVDQLTRENVASHLQKYRLYLKRHSSAANQQANMVAALGGGADSAFLRMGAGSFHDFNRSLQLQNRSFPSPGPGLLGRLNTPAGLVGLHGLSPSVVIPSAQAHIPRSRSSSVNGSNLLPEDEAGNVLRGIPMSLGSPPDQLQHQDATNPGGEPTVGLGNGNPPVIFTKSTSSSSNVIRGNNGDCTPTQGGAFVNQSSVTNLSDSSIRNGNWANSIPPSAVISTSFPFNGSYQTAFQPVVVNSPRDSFSTADIPLPSDSRLETQCRASASLLDNDMGQTIQGWDTPTVLNNVVFHQPDLGDGLMNNSSVAAAYGARPSSQAVEHNSKYMDSTLMGHPGSDSLTFRQQQNIAEQGSGLQLQLQAATKFRPPFGGYSVDASGFLEDVVTAKVKRV
ncbi:hypothetical protein Dimus_010130 [Dionaea muscipula]